MSQPWIQMAVALESLRLTVDPGFGAGARLYLEELERWSRVSRLTGYRSEADRVLGLVVDSLLFLAVIPEPAPPLLDIGSGPGVPGLVLKLARPAWKVTLVEANRRRANFMRHIIRRLTLDGVEVREARAETLVREPGMVGAFRTVTMRAVAAPETAMQLARPFLDSAGHAIIALGPGKRPSVGLVRHVEVMREDVGLRVGRTFLIIPATAESQPDVPRGTGGGCGPDPERRESEGRGGQDDDRRQPRRRAGCGRAADSPG